MLAWAAAAAFGVSLYGFAQLFSLDNEGDRKVIADFFKKIDTPVDVAREVFGAGKIQVSVFPLVGWTLVVMGGLMSLIFLTDLRRQESIIVGALVAFMIIFGLTVRFFGKRSEIRGTLKAE